jgi:hypothetical protein
MRFCAVLKLETLDNPLVSYFDGGELCLSFGANFPFWQQLTR